jgi:predicted O-linked N-acetylglucosamine transferase (SPINDLY family)
MTPEQAMSLAVEYHRSGRRAEAEAICRQILDPYPRHAPALHLLGILSGEAGRPDVAIELIGSALGAAPGVAVYHQDLGESYRRLGQWDKAIASLRRAIELSPGLTLAHKNLGRCLEAQGRLEEAVTAYRRAMKLAREDPEIHNLLGAALSRQGKRIEAIAAYRCAIKLNPDYAEAYTNLGNVLSSKGQTDEAIAAHQRAIALRPEIAVFHHNLASALKLAGRLEEAVAAYRHALALDPRLSSGHNNLGLTLTEMGRYEEAIEAYRRAQELVPDNVDVRYNLALALVQTGQTGEASALLRRNIELNPRSVASYNLLGVLFLQLNQYDEAIAILSQAIAIDPEEEGVLMNLGLALSEQGSLDEAVAALRQSIALNPKSSEGHDNLGKLLRDQGCIDDALTHFRQAIALRPDNCTAASNLIQTLHYHPDYDAQTILAECRRWAERFAAPLAAEIRPHPNDRTPDRRLRIGYISPDYRENHPIGQVVLPLFAHHDRGQIEVFAYCDVVTPDRVTERYRAAADAWRDTARLDDRKVAQQIRDDRIDILVDLALWSANNRLRVFARKPAPVQVTLLGMPTTSGLATMDYRLTDPYLDPPGTGTSETDGDYSERSIRLTHCLWCYPPIEGTPAVGALPALKNGFVTFGCLNQSAKLSRPALELWIRILQAVPDSQLRLVLPPCRHRDEIRALFRDGGIADDRLVFVPRISHLEYLQSFNELDFFLDPFPYNGHTTTLDALWMGVPVITLAGRTAVGRGGVSLLSNVGLTELIAPTPEHYIEMAVRSAGDLTSLAALRAGLRERMEASPLTDTRRYAADVEAAFRRMWMNWCGA